MSWWRSVLAIAVVACGPGAPPAKPGSPPVPLHVSPACDLAPAAGLEWIVEVKPRAIAQTLDLVPAVALVVPEARLDAFAAGHGGVDLRQTDELCVARYKSSTLSIVRGPFDPARVERAFADRVTNGSGRAVDVANPPVVRTWGEVAGTPEQLVILGRDALAFEDGKAGVTRIAEAFALGKLKRAVPALRGAALEAAAARVGDAPVRAFAPGPFEGQTAQGLGGLLRATTAIAISARFAGPPSRIAVRLVLMGAWADDAPAAAERLSAAVHVIGDSSLGHLLGLHEPVSAPQARATGDALVLDATIDGMALARGLHDALDAEVGEILRR